MKFIHIADVHLGAKPDAGRKYSETRGDEIWETFSGIIDICEAEKTDLLLIAGDLFHRQPLLRELKEVNYLFSKLSHTKVVLIAGNHDYMKWNSYYKTFAWNRNVFPLFGDRMGCVEFRELKTAVYGFSYYQKEIKERRYETAKPWKKQTYEILLAHGGDEKHIPMNRNELISLGYNYVAFGHIHKPGFLERNKIVYAGAPEPIDKNDVGAHGYIRGEAKDGMVTAEFVPAAKREYVHMIVETEESTTNMQLREMIKQQIMKRGVQNIYKIILKGFRSADTEFDVSGTDPFGNILEIADETKPAYSYEKLKEENRENLLGKYIESMGECEPDSLEYMALCEGVEALLATKRG